MHPSMRNRLCAHIFGLCAHIFARACMFWLVNTHFSLVRAYVWLKCARFWLVCTHFRLMCTHFRFMRTHFWFIHPFWLMLPHFQLSAHARFNGTDTFSVVGNMFNEYFVFIFASNCDILEYSWKLKCLLFKFDIFTEIENIAISIKKLQIIVV